MSQFWTKREFTRPATCGLKMADMTLDEMRRHVVELTDEEKKSPWAELYYERFSEKTQEQKDAFKAPLREDQMCMPKDIGRIMLEKDEHYPQIGYGVMANGVGYAAIRIDQDGITDEMVAEYREKYARDENNKDIFYKIWCPGKHLIHFEDGVAEDFGYGMMLMTMDWDIYGIENAGITEEYIREKDPNTMYFYLMGGPGRMLWAEGQEQGILMAQYMTESLKGRTLYVHFWIGIEPGENGTCIAAPKDSPELIAAKARCQMDHCITEYTHEMEHIKAFWNKNHPEGHR